MRVLALVIFRLPCLFSIARFCLFCPVAWHCAAIPTLGALNVCHWRIVVMLYANQGSLKRDEMGFRLLVVVMNRQPETLGVAKWCVAEPHTLRGFNLFSGCFCVDGGCGMGLVFGDEPSPLHFGFQAACWLMQ